MKKRILRLVAAMLAVTAIVVVSAGLTYYWCTRTVEVAVAGAGAGQDHSPGALHKVEQIGTYPCVMLRALVSWGNLPEPIAVQYGARMYRVQYWTTTPAGAATVASGLVCVPYTRTPRGVVSYQHGTTMNRHLTPSAPTLIESGLGTALFAGGGYVLCAADYVGLGTNREVHPYLHAQGTANAVIDLLKAANAFVTSRDVEWPSSLCLIGFSQGGYSTLAAQRALESLGDPRFRVVACAPVSGPYDLAGVTFPAFLEATTADRSGYLAYLANAYCSAYGRPLDSLLTDEYARQVPGLFDGEHDEWVVSGQLPARPREIFRREFLEAYDAKQPTWFMTALAENNVFQWAPKAPVRLYYSDRDPLVLPREAHVALAEFQRRDCDVTAIAVASVDHGGAILYAVPKIRNWFDEIAGKAK